MLCFKRVSRCKILFMKIAIVKLSALGDIIHAMIVLQLIKKYDKEIKIDWIVEEEYKGLLDSHPDINNVISINLKKAKKKNSIFLLIRELKKIPKLGSYDLVIDLQGLIKSALISRLIKAPLIIGFNILSICNMLLISESHIRIFTPSYTHSSFLWSLINIGEVHPLSTLIPLVTSAKVLSV